MVMSRGRPTSREVNRLLGRLFNGLMQRYGYPLAGAVIRAVRTLFWVAAVAVTTYVLDNWDVIEIPQAYKGLLLVVVMGLDKYVRERKAESDTGD